MKTSVYTMKTNYGYGIWQETSGKHLNPYSVVYTTQIKGLNELDKVFEGDYYFSKLIYDDFSKEKNKIQPYRSQEVVYLGEYELTKEYPKYARGFDLHSKRTWKYEWVIYNLKEGGFLYYTDQEAKDDKNILKNPNKILAYKKVNPEILNYPIYNVETLLNLRKKFDSNYHLRDFDDDYVMKLKEEYFKEKKSKAKDIKNFNKQKDS